jgi:MFS family permease
MSMPQASRVRTTQQERRALLSGIAGNSIEYYEFAIYGLSAALVFGKLMFPSFSPIAGTLLSFATFAIAFVARPIGGLLFGHFGDKLGRKGTLIATLLMMGIATFGIGLLPSYNQIGIWSPVLLVFLRLLQGISLGGEYTGSVLMALEHAHATRRGFFGALVSSGVGWGTLLANMMFLLVSQLPNDQFMSWGWRVPFLFSAILVGICMFMRLRLEESPEFRSTATEVRPEKAPLLEVAREHSAAVVAVTLSILGSGVLYYVGTVYLVKYATGISISKGSVLTAVLLVNVVLIIGMPLFGWLGDVWNRRAILLISFVGMAMMPWVLFALLHTGKQSLIILGYILTYIPFAANYSALPATLAHAFPAKVRYTGMALGYNFGALLSSSIAPMVATLLQDKFGNWHAIAVYISIASVISLFGAATIRERYVSASTVKTSSPGDRASTRSSRETHVNDQHEVSSPIQR